MKAAYRELTIPAIIVGILFGSLMCASFVYISLKLGTGLGGSAVAAIMGFAILKGALKNGTIVENNINQTVASGINIASSGVAFTLPALFLLSVDDPTLAGFAATPFILAAMAGSFMGILLIIPLRKQMIEFERLRFPSGVAVATLLKSPGAGARQAKLLVGGFIISAIFTALDRVGILPEELDIGTLLGVPAHVPIVIALSFANVGAGLLSGRGGLAFVAGGVLAWWVISPATMAMGWIPDTGLEGQADFQMGALYSTMIRPLGIGMLVGGAIMGVIMSLPALKGAIKSLSTVVQARSGGSGADAEELPSKILGIGILCGLIALFLAAMLAGGEDLSIGQAVGVAVVGGLWLGLAGLVVAQATGMTDISPISGMALIAVTLMFFVTEGNVIASIMLGTAVCVGIGQCADMMQDLKTGHLVGSVPRRQQLVQFGVGWIGAPIAVGTVFLLWSAGPGGAGGFGPGTDLTAPQAGALQAIVESLRSGNVPLEKYTVGTALGLALGLYPIGGLGVLVGLAMYLPISITLGYGVGCVMSIGLEKKLGKRWIGSTLVPVAAGFIVGEALTSLVIVLIKLGSA
ncbi:MAG: putative OPT family oligopeptide transporter [Myxococcota bacterium]